MSKLILMAIIAAGVMLASCQTQQRSLFADEPAAGSVQQVEHGPGDPRL